MLKEGNITKADLYLDNIERIFLLYNTSLIDILILQRLSIA